MNYCIIRTIHEIPDCVDKVLSDEKLSACMERCLDVKLCLFELLGNALMHCMVPDYEVQVHVSWRFDNQSVHIQIYSDKPTCGVPGKKIGIPEPEVGDMLSEHGRGLFLVAALAETFWYSDDFKHMSLTIRW